MSESSKTSKHNLTPRRAAALGVAAVVLAGGKGLGGCGSSAGNVQSGVSERIPTVLKANPATKDPITLDCVDSWEITKKGQAPVKDTQGGAPRMDVFESNQGTLWGAQVLVKWGVIIRNGEGEVIGDDTSSSNYWLGEDNTGNPITTRYGSDNGQLPDSEVWEGQLQIPARLVEHGTQLPNIGTDPEGDGTQAVIARISPSFFEDFDGDAEPQSIHDPGTFAVECQRADRNTPLPSSQQIKLNPTQIDIIHVPDSTTVYHTPKEG
jgi:hypothetical protein